MLRVSAYRYGSRAERYSSNFTRDPVLSELGENSLACPTDSRPSVLFRAAIDSGAGKWKATRRVRACGVGR